MFANNLALSVHKTFQSDHNHSKLEIQGVLHKQLFLKHLFNLDHDRLPKPNVTLRLV